MIKKLILAMVLVVPVSAIAGNASVSIGGSNSFNNNSGSISVSQSNALSSRDVAIEEKLNSQLANAASTLANQSATAEQKKEAAETIHFGSMAKEINSMQASVQQKNRLCQSKVKAVAEIMGYSVGFFFDRCNEVFK